MSKDMQRSPTVFYGWVMVTAMASIGATTMGKPPVSFGRLLAAVNLE